LLGRLRSGGSRFKASFGKQMQDPISKISRAKWTGDIAQAVECLFCKLKALNSNPNSTKKRNGFTFGIMF
jgi:hypothetical protein